VKIRIWNEELFRQNKRTLMIIFEVNLEVEV